MGYKILIIDDDRISTYISRKVINKALPGIEVQEFHNARSALRYLSDHPEKDGQHHIIFLDINMPEVSGWDFLDELDRQLADQAVRVNMLTSSVDPSDREKAKTYRKVESFISKPIQLEHLERLRAELDNLVR